MAASMQQAPTTLAADIVGNAFVHLYYLKLRQSPELVHKFYEDVSKYGRPKEDGAMSITTTMQAINDKILSLDHEEFSAEITTVDAQESYNGSVLVLVTGNLTGKDNVRRRKFTQSFFLAPQDKGYFVLNDGLITYHAASLLTTMFHPCKRIMEMAQSKKRKQYMLRRTYSCVPISSSPTQASLRSIKSQEQQLVASTNAAVDNGNSQEGPRVYLKGLPVNATHGLVENEFKRFGTIRSGGIQSIKMHKGFCSGFVEFVEETAVQSATEASPILIKPTDV
ncbi:hypothetical protein LWI29_026261 [Acer saccharum]|uniref:NTF2 domain-containing protein n=1 Tax=Acer saccharum TaxID=4024 RepID=A0AA39VEB5_ACESA|nr:hypothetical protein LWI29_026261 [Acer saccharum]